MVPHIVKILMESAKRSGTYRTSLSQFYVVTVIRDSEKDKVVLLRKQSANTGRYRRPKSALNDHLLPSVHPIVPSRYESDKEDQLLGKLLS